MLRTVADVQKANEEFHKTKDAPRGETQAESVEELEGWKGRRGLDEEKPVRAKHGKGQAATESRILAKAAKGGILRGDIEQARKYGTLAAKAGKIALGQDSFPATDMSVADVQRANDERWGRKTKDWTGDSQTGDAVPGLNNWSMHAGGTGAAPDKHGYTHSVSHGETNTNLHTQYSISPVSNSSGRHQGYVVGAWSPKAGHAHKQLGQVRDPRHGVKLAQAHYNEHFNSDK